MGSRYTEGGCLLGGRRTKSCRNCWYTSKMEILLYLGKSCIQVMNSDCQKKHVLSWVVLYFALKSDKGCFTTLFSMFSFDLIVTTTRWWLYGRRSCCTTKRSFLTTAIVGRRSCLRICDQKVCTVERGPTTTYVFRSNSKPHSELHRPLILASNLSYDIGHAL